MKLRMFIVCDDVRQEVGAKHSLMGLLDDDIDVSRSGDALPTIRMSMYIELDLEPEDPIPTTFRFELAQEGAPPAKAGGDVRLPENRPRMLRFIASIGQTPPLHDGMLNITFGLNAEGTEVFSAQRSLRVNLRDQAQPTH